MIRVAFYQQNRHLRSELPGIRFPPYFRKHFKTLNNLLTIKKALYLNRNFNSDVSIILPSSVHWSVRQNNVRYTNAKSNYRRITYILLII